MYISWVSFINNFAGMISIWWMISHILFIEKVVHVFMNWKEPNSPFNVFNNNLKHIGTVWYCLGMLLSVFELSFNSRGICVGTWSLWYRNKLNKIPTFTVIRICIGTIEDLCHNNYPWSKPLHYFTLFWFFTSILDPEHFRSSQATS